jgi:hypothetical protein
VQCSPWRIWPREVTPPIRIILGWPMPCRPGEANPIDDATNILKGTLARVIVHKATSVTLVEDRPSIKLGRNDIIGGSTQGRITYTGPCNEVKSPLGYGYRCENCKCAITRFHDPRRKCRSITLKKKSELDLMGDRR